MRHTAGPRHPRLATDPTFAASADFRDSTARPQAISSGRDRHQARFAFRGFDRIHDAGRFEKLGGKVQQRSASRHSGSDLAGVGCGVGDELPQCVCRHGRVQHGEDRVGRRQADTGEVPDRGRRAVADAPAGRCRACRCCQERWCSHRWPHVPQSACQRRRARDTIRVCPCVCFALRRAF